MTNIELARQLVAKFPDHGNRTLGRLLYKENSIQFANLEAAQQAIRTARGAHGKKLQHTYKMDTILTPARTPMPTSSAKPRKPFILPQGKTMILSDIHIPYHDEESLACALKYGDEYQPDNILLNGDTIDFYAVSRWEKDPKVRNLPQELEKTRQLLAHLRARFPKTRIIWKNGNHEERWEKYLWNKAPELCGVPDFELEVILRFSEHNIEFVHGRQKIKAGKHLTIIHGHEIPGAFDPVNFARTLAVKMKVSTIAGHKHKVSEHTEKDADGKYITCWSLGCFEEMTPDYMPINAWGHGFATLLLDGNDFTVSNHRIIKGKIR